MVVAPVAWVVGGRLAPEDDEWAREVAHLHLDASIPSDALAGLEAFSHIEVIFHFHRVSPSAITFGARHPRERQDWPAVGIFAQRGRVRPNRLGVSVCRLLAVADRVLTVQGLDAIDGTPILDIKPVVREFLPRGEVTQPAWMTELMAQYWGD